MHRCLTIVLGCSTMMAAPAAEPAFKAGTASVVITPTENIWMAGYASRTKPAEGKEHDLYAKALALEDSGGTVLVLVTTDLVGLPRAVSEPVAREVAKRTGLSRDRLMLTSSHTHCGPVVRDNLMDMYDLTPQMRQKVIAYGDTLRDQLVGVILAALKDRAPVQLRYGQGTARFAVNRREPTDKGIINGRNPAGPVDHSVPVLSVAGLDGKLRAVVFGYACHNTTQSYLKWCGDYAGFAQQELEARHPGAVAMFWSGCGADANPLPRGTTELCRKYGKELALAVNETLASSTLNELTGNNSARYAEIELPFDSIPPRDRWVADVAGKNFIARERAKRFLTMLDNGTSVPDRYPSYPVQVWRIGKLNWIALGGEVVVDYALRLKKESGGPTWVTAYANDVMAYIPSERVLKEGGYEGDSSMLPYGLPARWAPGIEAKIVGKVHELARP